MIGCLDNLNPYAIWQGTKVLDSCELSGYVTHNVYEWNIFPKEADYFLLPEKEVLMFDKDVCFPGYTNILMYFQNPLTTDNLLYDVYLAIKSVRDKFD